MIQSMNVRLGAFHQVVGVAVTQNCISILDITGSERMISVKPKFDRVRGKFDPLHIMGEFGDFSKAKTGHHLEGLDFDSITDVEVTVDLDTEEDFHTRILSVKHLGGLSLSWKLFCEGKAP